MEPLEGRLLLSGTPGVSQVTYQNASYTVALAGPGQIKLHKSGTSYSIALTATTSSSSVVVVQNSITSKYNGSLLPLSGLTVGSGQLGQFLGAGAVDLTGTIQSSQPIQALQLGQVGPATRIIASGGLGSLLVTGDLHLGPKGKIQVTGDLSGGLQAGSLELAGGQISVGHNLAGLVSGSVALTASGSLSVGNNSGGIMVSGTLLVDQGSSIVVGQDLAGLAASEGLTVASGGRISVGRDLTGLVSSGSNATIDAGQIAVGRDLVGAVTIAGSLALADQGNLTVGRDLVGAFTVGGNLALSVGGMIDVARNVDGGLNVGGNLGFLTGGSMTVGGEFDGLSVTGQIFGQGTTAVDLTVGLDLNNWTVLGGVAGQGSVSAFNLDVRKDINGITIAHGLFNDYLTAGVILTGGTSGGTVGPDGAVAVFDTVIRAGLGISNLNFAGDVESDRPTNPSGGLTRIVAGEDRSGHFELGSGIIGLTIAGSLIDAVLAAGVEPFGGNGSLSLTPVPAPGPGELGVYGPPNGGAFANYGMPFLAPPFAAGTQDLILPGSINLPFAQSKTISISGVVITTKVANGSDYAGVYASNTAGIFLGPASSGG